MRIFFTLFNALLAAVCISSAFAQSIDEDAVGIVDKRSPTARILGGGDAEPGEYPSIVALVQSVRPGFEQYAPALDQRLFCGGTLVAERWVLTAGHCAYDLFKQPLSPESLNVVAGIHDLAQDSPIEELRVVEIVIHPDFDYSLSLPPNDIALLKLEKSVTTPVAALFAGDSDEYSNALGFIAGWGAIDNADESNPIYPTSLQDAVVPLVSDEVCNAPQSYDGLIARNHLCAGYADGQIDACSGDSGGPLFIMVDGVQVQAAITSFGIGCGQPLFYGIYTDLSYFIPWLSLYIPVPYQSPELVARRASEENLMYTGASSDEDSVFGGSLGWLMFLSLIGFCCRKPLAA